MVSGVLTPKLTMHQMPGSLTHPPSVPGPAHLSPHKALGILVFLTPSISTSTVPWLYNMNSHDLWSWPPDFGLHLVWKASDWLPIGKRLAPLLPALWLRCSWRGHIRILCWRSAPTFDSCCWHCQQSAPQRPTLFLSSHCLIEWGRVPRGCLPRRLLFWSKVGMGGSDT